MKCTADDIKVLLPDYVSGDLGPDEKSLIEEHLAQCPECTEFIVQIERVYGGVDRLIAEESDRHLDSDELIDFADNPDDMDAGARDRVEKHLIVCDKCRTEYDNLVELNAELATQLQVSLPAPPTFADRLRGFFRGISALFRRPAFAYGVSTAAILSLTISVMTNWRTVRLYSYYDNRLERLGELSGLKSEQVREIAQILLSEADGAGYVREYASLDSGAVLHDYGREAIMEQFESVSADLSASIVGIASSNLAEINRGGPAQGQLPTVHITRDMILQKIYAIITIYPFWPDLELYRYDLSVANDLGVVVCRALHFKDFGEHGATHIGLVGLPWGLIKDGPYSLKIIAISLNDGTVTQEFYFPFKLTTSP